MGADEENLSKNKMLPINGLTAVVNETELLLHSNGNSCGKLIH